MGELGLEQKRFRIQAIGPIKSGTFQYVFDDHALRLSYDLHATVGALFLTKKLDFTGSQVVSPHEMDSATYSKVGQRLRFGNVRGTITEIKDKVATVLVTVDDVSAHGTAWFSLAGKYVELLHLDAEGSYGPFSFRIIAMQDK